MHDCCIARHRRHLPWQCSLSFLLVSPPTCYSADMLSSCSIGSWLKLGSAYRSWPEDGSGVLCYLRLPKRSQFSEPRMIYRRPRLSSKYS
ncbi:hypothetical protein K461DRAFT_96880 [Myriangium duriaei CBS 260.36]|uniref:Secreted protein n=1 Tax=Myriangium duriaei CBS 260.36 TaxID=1168546 RepID=A0A9P4JBB2_9PEZI|nr:hypothetical protein K461DRAFT_96880 [Myriangium duriaei CBS 260.36]